MKKLYKWLTKYIHTFIFAAYLVTGVVLMTPKDWWLLRVSVVWIEVAMVILMAIGTHKKWPRYGDTEEKAEASKPTDNTLHTIELAGDEMSLSEAVEVLEHGDWIKLLSDDRSRTVWDVRCQLFEAQEVAIEAIQRDIGRWISVKDQLPTREDTDEAGSVLAIHISPTCKKRYFHWRTVVENPTDFSHWMKVPRDP